MKPSTKTRELMVLDGFDVPVCGTYHPPHKQRSSWQSAPEASRPGVLFLNSLSATRAAHGDSSVYWADAFAERGYPSFRLDFPGFGDSGGDPPPELLNFINSGGYAAVSAAIATEVVERFGLSGVVIVGLCAGAVSAPFAAAASKQCRGLVLMDPYFHLPLKSPPWLWQKLTGRISRSPLGRIVDNLYVRLKTAGTLLLGDRPPSNANVPLLNCWKGLASFGLPILVFKAPGVKQAGGEFDYLGHLLKKAGRKSRMAIKVIEGAGHTFSNSTGRMAVERHTLEWLNACFPFITGEEARSEEAATRTPRPRPLESHSELGPVLALTDA